MHELAPLLSVYAVCAVIGIILYPAYGLLVAADCLVIGGLVYVAQKGERKEVQ